MLNSPSQLFHVMKKTVVALQINSPHTCLCVCLLSKNMQSIQVRSTTMFYVFQIKKQKATLILQMYCGLHFQFLRAHYHS
jgi:hypothetical protein